MALAKVKSNVSGGKGGERWNRRAVCKAAAKKVRRAEAKKVIKEVY